MRIGILILIRTIGTGILVLLLAACQERPTAPCVRLVGDVASTDIQAAAAWEPLGFDFSVDDSGLPECDQNWYQPGHDRACQITIGIRRDATLRARRGTNAMTDRAARLITIDSSVVELIPASIAMAHEVGHVVLDTAEHTQGGIMGGASNALSQVDRDLACRAIGICI